MVFLEMTDVTQLLEQIEAGDGAATERLLPLVYEELRKLAAQKLANEKAGQTLQATSLVHEAYLRLVKFKPTQGDHSAITLELPSASQLGTEKSEKWNGRGHFFSAAAEAMRRILVDNARRKQAEKRGGARSRVELTDMVQAESLAPLELLALDEALQQLTVAYPQHAQLVKLRFFAGLTIEDSAASLDISLATAKRHWAFARAWLFGQLAELDAK